MCEAVTWTRSGWWVNVFVGCDDNTCVWMYMKHAESSLWPTDTPLTRISKCFLSLKAHTRPWRDECSHPHRHCRVNSCLLCFWQCRPSPRMTPRISCWNMSYRTAHHPLKRTVKFCWNGVRKMTLKTITILTAADGDQSDSVWRNGEESR